MTLSHPLPRRETDPWYIGISGPMRRALDEIAKAGKLYRFAGTYGAHVFGLQFQEQTVLALVERRLVEIRKPGRHTTSHYAVLTGIGRLFTGRNDASMAD